MESGLPVSMIRRSLDVSCYGHAREFVAAAWQGAAAKSRVSMLETLSVALPVLARELAGTPDADVLRRAVRKALNQNEHALKPDQAERRALAGLERASLPVSALSDGDSSPLRRLRNRRRGVAVPSTKAGLYPAA